MTPEHQDRLLARADSAADAVEQVIRDLWQQLLDIIHAGGHHFEVLHKARVMLRSLPSASHAVVDALARLAQSAAADAAQHIARKLSPSQRAALLLEDEFEFHEIERLILPPLPMDRIRQVIHAAGWEERLTALTRLAQPDVLAARIANAVQAGQSVAQIARDIRPVLQGVQTSARRVARTAGLWIAHEAELHTYEQLGDMIIGYQVHAVLDHATRPEHRRRDGFKYYRRPSGNRRGFDQMPRPPREADGSWAYNCRCFLEPILQVE